MIYPENPLIANIAEYFDQHYEEDESEIEATDDEETEDYSKLGLEYALIFDSGKSLNQKTLKQAKTVNLNEAKSSIKFSGSLFFDGYSIFNIIEQIFDQTHCSAASRPSDGDESQNLPRKRCL